MRTTNAVRVAEVDQERATAAYTWLSTTEAGERAGGVSAEKVREWITSGALQALNVGTAKRPDYRIRPDWLEAFVARRTLNANA